MSFDLVSFVLGALAGGAAAFFFAIASEAGKATWKRIHDWWFPPDQKVHDTFLPIGEYQPDIGWVLGTQAKLHEADGWTYYLHPKTKARCFRVINGEAQYLFVRPGQPKP